MINAALQIFVNKVQVAGRISFGDVKRLQRDILPDGISSREEAELLLTLEQTAAWVDAAFGDWLVAMMVDFVVWGMRPTGIADAGKAAWLLPFVASPQATRTLRRLVQELVHEAERADPALLSPPLNRAAQGAGSKRASAELRWAA
jgi:hypothetical protein